MPSRPKHPSASDAAAAPVDRTPARPRARYVRLPAGVTVAVELDPLAKLRSAAWQLMGQGRWGEAAQLAARIARLPAPASEPKPEAPTVRPARAKRRSSA